MNLFENNQLILFPAGPHLDANGTISVMNAKIADVVIQNFKSAGVDIPVDFNHASVQQSDAPAAGWITEITFDESLGLLGKVEWLEGIEERIQNKEYKYTSPVFSLNKNNEVQSIHSLALTNTPATKKMTELLAANHIPEFEDMNFLAGINKINLKPIEENNSMNKKKIKREAIIVEEAPPEVEAEVTEANSALETLRQLMVTHGITLSEDADTDAIILAAVEWFVSLSETSPEEVSLDMDAIEQAESELVDGADTEMATVEQTKNPLEFVTRSQFNEISSELNKLKDINKKVEVKKLIEWAVEERKVNPNDENQMKWARTTALSDPDAFKMHVESAPALYPSQTEYTHTDGSSNTDSRESIITRAKKDWNGNGEIQKRNTLKAWVNGELRTASHTLASKEELI